MIRKINYKRFAKFSTVGFTSSIIDFFILNVLSLFSGIDKGFFAAIFSVISFLVANINSYILNKKWTFKKNNIDSRYKTFLKVSIAGVLINASMIYALTTLISQDYVSGIIWLNMSKVTATFIVMFFNYFGYKKYVFNYKKY
ncbi:MAG: GtrA family protein [Candidatus Pacebacteria bacterium]|nr:GtrA family protein [Candidatus Paceibacterota bacterium]